MRPRLDRLAAAGESAARITWTGMATGEVNWGPLAGLIVLEEGAVRLANGRMELCGGVLENIEIRAGVLEDGFPCTLTGVAKNIDLAVFSQEFAIPSVTLTGIEHHEHRVKAILMG